MTIDYGLTIAGLDLGPGTNYIVHSVDGFGIPTTRVGDSPRPRDHGLFYGLDFMDGRTITISLTVRGATPSEVVANLDTLLAAWKPIYSDSLTISALAYKFPGQVARLLRGRPRQAKADTSRIIGNRVPVTLEYVAADPRQYAAAGSVGTVGMATSSGGRTYNRIYNLSYGASGSVFLFATNAGDFVTKPILKITGPAANPHVENLTTGEVMKFALTLAAGDILTIDCDARTVLLNGTASRYSSLSSDSAFITMQPGSNTLRFIADTYQPAASLEVDWSSAWL